MRFKKSKKIGSLRLNLSKSGLGASFGVKGARIGISSTGKTYHSVGIPETGIYDVKYHSSDKSENVSEVENEIIDSTNAIKSTSQNNDFSYYDLNFNDDLMIIKRVLNELNQSNPLIGCFAFISLILLFINKWLFFIAIAIGIFIYCIVTSDTTYNNKNIAKKILEALANNSFKTALNEVEKLTDITDYNKSVLKRYCYYKLDDYEKVYEILKQYDYKSDRVLLLKVCEKLDKYQEMIDIIQELPEDLKHNASIITILGECYFKLDKNNIALEVLVNTEGTPIKKRKMNKDIAYFRYILASVYIKNGDKKKAITQLNKILAYNEKFLDAKEKLEELENEK